MVQKQLYSYLERDNLLSATWFGFGRGLFVVDAVDPTVLCCVVLRVAASLGSHSVTSEGLLTMETAEL